MIVSTLHVEVVAKLLSSYWHRLEAMTESMASSSDWHVLNWDKAEKNRKIVMNLMVVVDYQLGVGPPG